MVAENRITPPPTGLTVKWLETLRPREKTFDVPDRAARGLTLRVLPSGVMKFRWVINSLKRVVTIGPWSKEPQPGHVTIKQAREWLEKLKAARLGGVPQLDAVEAQLRAELAPRQVAVMSVDQGPTVASVAEGFLKLLKSTRKRPDEARYIYEKDIAPVIGHIPLRSLKKSDCRNVVERVVERGAKVHAGKVLGLLKQLLTYAANLSEHGEFTNPIRDLKAAYLGVESNMRSRWLSEEEIPLFWSALETDKDAPREERAAPLVSGVDPRTRYALRILLLTAVRSAELRLAKWEDLDLESEEPTWTVPVASQKLTVKQAKAAAPFVIPLPPTAVALFEALKAFAGESPWVLASEAADAGRYSEKALGRAMRRLWRSHPDLRARPLATPHDLRRTARTWMSKLGIPRDVAERCLNHALPKVERTYSHDDMLGPRREALLKWDAFVQRLVMPSQSNVAFLPAAANA